MEAVIATGGKQYRVAPGQVISVEKLAGDPGASVQFTSVLMVNRDGEVLTGSSVASARVSGEVVRQELSKKVSIVKFKRRKNFRRNRGHRQPLTAIRITNIEV
jgi:large subunit ribosomal protein L21